MFNYVKNKKALIGLVVGLTLAQPTLASTINFDRLAAGANANLDLSANALGITFNNAAFLPTLDGDGIAIVGSEHWQIDNTHPVTAENTFAQGWGVSPSGQNALDARAQPVLMGFASAMDIGSFSFTLPNSTYGNTSPTDILFLDASGNTLYDLVYSQYNNPLAIVSLLTPVLGVKDIVLASGTFYDDINVAAVPVPGAVWLFGSALMGFMGFLRLNKKA
ncbi:MAG: hypothetical protein WCP96_08930 [Methylococcaceae bacterium]